MLNKEICLKCSLFHFVDENFKQWGCRNIKQLGQISGNGTYYVHESTHLNKESDNPPEHCPYVLEHIMETQKC